MRGVRARLERHIWSFRDWARRSGERVCSADHHESTSGGHPCPNCKAVR